MSTHTDKKLESLEAKLAANHGSKIFLPLAEQYRMQGDLERAAAVLTAGLKQNPGYNVARVALGRVHLERGEMTLGRRLLAKLLLEVPDNLLARKLLDDAGGPLPESEDSHIHTLPDGVPAPSEPGESEPGESEPGESESGDPGFEAHGSDDPVVVASEEAELSDLEVPEAEDLGFHVQVGDGLTEENTKHPVVMDQASSDLAEAAAGSESVWTDPQTDLEDPPSPEPGVWKEDDEVLTQSGADVDSEANLEPTSVSPLDSPPESESEPQPFETVRLQRSELLPVFSPGPELPAAPDGAEDATEELAAASPEVEVVAPEVEEVTPEVEAAAPEVEDVTPEVEAAAPEVEDVTPAVEAVAPEEREAESFRVEGVDPVLDEEPSSGESLEMETPELPAVEEDLSGVAPMTAEPETTAEESPASVNLWANELRVAVFDAEEPSLRTPVSVAEEEEADRTLSLARLYRRQGRLDLSADIYREILVADPEHPAARRELEELCGRNVPEITDDDLVPEAAVIPEGVPLASAESMEDARLRKITFLRAWLEHIRQQD